VKSPSDIDDAGGGALELAHRAEAAGSGLSGRHGGARSRCSLPGRSARGRSGTSSRDVLLFVLPHGLSTRAACGVFSRRGLFSRLLLSRPPAACGTLGLILRRPGTLVSSLPTRLRVSFPVRWYGRLVPEFFCKLRRQETLASSLQKLCRVHTLAVAVHE